MTAARVVTKGAAGAQSGFAPKSKVKHRPYIQGLRAIAVLLVMVAHAELPVSGGFVGVDVFFVISGFVITLGLAGELAATGKVSLRDFYVRRVCRLLPALAVTVVFTVAVGALLLSPFGTQQATAKTAIGAATFSSNLVLEKVSAGYFGAEAQLNPLLHIWSLSLEEQFYFLLPLVFVIAGLVGLAWRRAARGFLVLAVAAVWVVSFGACLYIASGNPIEFAGFEFGGYYGPVGRFWEFATGCMLALWVTGGTPSLGRAGGTVATLLGFAALAVSAVWIEPTMAFPGPVTLLPVAATALVIIGGESHRDGLVRYISGSKLTTIGDYSYSLYLWHWPIIVFTKNVVDSRWSAVLGAIVSVVFAAVAYKTIELRFTARRGTSPWKGVAVFAAATTATLLCAGGLGVGAQKSWWSPTIEADYRTISEEHAITKAHCDHMPTPEMLDTPACTLREGEAGAVPVYLIGDSHADHISEAVLESPSTARSRVVAAEGRACPVTYPKKYNNPGFSDARNTQCATFAKESREWITGQPDGIVVVSSADMYWSIGERQMEPRTPLDEVYSAQGARLQYEGLSQYVEELVDAGHKVVLVQTTPTWWYLPHYFDPASCTTVAALRGGCSETASLEAVRRTQGVPRDVVSTVARDFDVSVVDPWEMLCDGEVCSATFDGRIAYRDTQHITVDMARALTPLFDDVLGGVMESTE